MSGKRSRKRSQGKSNTIESGTGLNEKDTKTVSKPSFRVEKIGTVAIDTGHVVIVDPCRIDEVEQRFDGTLEGQLGQFVVGSQTGLGDGRYPVFAEVMDHPELGKRVTALHIHFDPVYCFADDPKNAELIKQDEAEFLAFMNRQ